MAARSGIPTIEEPGLAEWRAVDEPESRVRLRMISVFQRAARESAEDGPTGLVSHGGPIALLLEELGMPSEELSKYRRMFDTTNPLPPAGVWEVEKNAGEERWRFRWFSGRGKGSWWLMVGGWEGVIGECEIRG